MKGYNLDEKMTFFQVPGPKLFNFIISGFVIKKTCLF